MLFNPHKCTGLLLKQKQKRKKKKKEYLFHSFDDIFLGFFFAVVVKVSHFIHTGIFSILNLNISFVLVEYSDENIAWLIWIVDFLKWV